MNEPSCPLLPNTNAVLFIKCLNHWSHFLYRSFINYILVGLAVIEKLIDSSKIGCDDHLIFIRVNFLYFLSF